MITPKTVYRKLKENIDLILAFTPIVLAITLIVMIISGVLKVHIEF